jgi:hypothetical protein
MEDGGWRIEDRGSKIAQRYSKRPSLLYPLSSILHPLSSIFFILVVAFYSFPDVAHCGVNNPYKIRCFSNALRLARLCSGANTSTCGSATRIPRTSG